MRVIHHIICAGALVTVALAAPPAVLAAQISFTAAVGGGAPGQTRIEQYRLPNGLTVLLSQDRSMSTAAFGVTYRTAGAEGRLVRLIAGPSTFGAASRRATLEKPGDFAVVSPDQLEAALLLKASQMRALSGAENSASPNSVCEACAAFGLPADVSAVALRDVQRLVQGRYAPSNAVLVVVGNFDPARTRKVIAQHFGTLPAGALPSPSLQREITIVVSMNDAGPRAELQTSMVRLQGGFSFEASR